MKATMKAARMHQWGGTENLYLDDVPLPEPKAHEVLIRVRAAGVNPVDWKAQEGLMRQFLSLPFTLGWEVAGEVAELGEDAADSGLHLGDAVYAKPGGGGFAQFVAVRKDNVAPKPKSLDFKRAAVFPVAALTAYQALFDHGQLQAGQKVLIHGAAGGIGHFAVQLAKWKGAFVIGTASARNEAFVRGLGADEFIDYSAVRFEDVVQDADLVLDTVGGETLERSYAAAKAGGLIVTVAGRPAEDATRARGVRAVGFAATSTRPQLDEMARLIDAGVVKPTISAVYPLERAGEALDQNHEGHTRGKIAVEIG